MAKSPAVALVLRLRTGKKSVPSPPPAPHRHRTMSEGPSPGRNARHLDPSLAPGPDLGPDQPLRISVNHKLEFGLICFVLKLYISRGIELGNSTQLDKVYPSGCTLLSFY